VNSEQDATSVSALLERAVTIAGKATKTQEAIVAQQQRSKRTTRWLIVSVALDVALSIVTIALALGQVSASSAIHQSQLNGCAIGNELRAAQISLWEHVFALSAPARETSAQRRQRLATEQTFRAYIRVQFAPVDCVKLYRR
jgi:hypothetical protein